MEEEEKAEQEEEEGVEKFQEEEEVQAGEGLLVEGKEEEVKEKNLEMIIKMP